MHPYLQSLERLIAAAKAKDNDAFIACFTPDLEYAYHTGAKPIKGAVTLRKFLDRYHDTLELTAWDVDNHAVNGNKLLVEGYEEYQQKADGKLVGHPYMSVLEFDDSGLITHMREYYEMDGKPRSQAA